MQYKIRPTIESDNISDWETEVKKDISLAKLVRPNLEMQIYISTSYYGGIVSYNCVALKDALLDELIDLDSFDYDNMKISKKEFVIPSSELNKELLNSLGLESRRYSMTLYGDPVTYTHYTFKEGFRITHNKRFFVLLEGWQT